MRVFISWSGERSRQVAELLSTWIKCVIQATKPWISSEIDRGALWFNAINKELHEALLGIICLTKENKEKPWILFEAGALAKGLSNTKVCTFLIDLQHADVQDPLAQFNHTLPTRDGIHKLILTLNNHLQDDQRLEPAVLAKVFETYWTQFEKQFQNILATTSEAPANVKREDSDVLKEVLENSRNLSRRIANIEQSISPNHHRKEIINTASVDEVVKSATEYATFRIKSGATDEILVRELLMKYDCGNRAAEQIIRGVRAKLELMDL